MTKEEKIMHELYRRSFAASEPPAVWEDMLANAELNELGQKVIPYLDHECEEETLKSIFESVMKEYRVPKRKRSGFYFSFMLGCSPKTKTVTTSIGESLKFKK
jgi:hypothetical protein